MTMNSIVYSAWNCDPPRIYAISQPLPNAPDLPLSGGSMARMPLESFIKDLQTDIEKQTGHYYAYVKNSEGDEPDTYILQTWEVYKGDNSCYEALVILYYAPLNPYLTYKKHMGEHWAQEYLDELALVAN